MKQITKQTLDEIEKQFRTDKGYILQIDNQIFCPQVNGLTAICLAELGFQEKAKQSCIDFLKSPSYNASSNLFHREVDLEGKLIAPQLNTCKNSVAALALAMCGLAPESEKLMRALKNSRNYFPEEGLFGREYNPQTNEINRTIIVQSNLWAALAYAELGKNQEAKTIISNLEKTRNDNDNGLFQTRDSRFLDSERFVYVDDQALAMLAYSAVGETDKAKKIADAVLKSDLYDAKTGLFNCSFSANKIDYAKSTYKNSFMAYALGKLGYKKELEGIQEGLVRDLYDSSERLFRQKTTDETKVPDNSALALVALEYENTKHNLF